MSETVLAALIAAGATMLTTLLQLKISLSRGESSAARSSTSSRRKNKMPVLLLGVMLTAAAVGGFAFSQWFADRERIQQQELRQELQARITDISRTAGELKQTRLDTLAEVQTEVLRQMGSRGVIALATVSPCRATPSPIEQAAPAAETSATPVSDASASTPAAATAVVPPAPAPVQTPSAAACTEAEAVRVTLCAPVPTGAAVSHVDLFTRYADSDTAWKSSQVKAGEESEQARFSEQASETLADDGTKHVCHTFANWSTQRSRIARIVVRYAIAEERSEPQTQVRHERIPAPAGALAVR